MSYSVIWLAPALKELAEVWMAAPDRDAVAKATDAIDDLLGQSPLDVGESRQGATRILFHHPLAVYYAVSESEARVFVWDVWRTKR